MASRSIIVHSSSHHGRTAQTGRKKNPLQPKILSLKFAKKPRNKITMYAQVQSVSRPDRLVHSVVRRNRKLVCSCEANILGGNRCSHIRAVARRLRKAAA
jgi:hypothetical protein